MLRKAIRRLYSDYLMPDRLHEFREVIIRAKDSGYHHLTISSYIQAIREGIIPDKVFIHRHDIDSDPKRAEKFFEIEKSLDIRSSYYFRLKTMDVPMMSKICLFGSEVGYHYEEVATYAFMKKIRKEVDILENLDPIRDLFRENMKVFSSKLPRPVTTIASHGDFVNRMLGVPNHVLVDDSIRQEFNLLAECYDEWLISSFDIMISDRPYPQFYHPGSPFDAIEDEVPVIYMLSHPRHWGTNPVVNLKEDSARMLKGAIYRYIG